MQDIKAECLGIRYITMKFRDTMKMRQNINAEYLGVKNIAKKFMECQEN